MLATLGELPTASQDALFGYEFEWDKADGFAYSSRGMAANRSMIADMGRGESGFVELTSR
jgi:hypothetical protein